MARNVVTASNKASRIEGLPELLAQVNALRVKGQGPAVMEIFMEAARVLKDEIARRAAWNHIKQALYLKKKFDPEKPHVLVGIYFLKARDVFWLEYGTLKSDARRPKKAKLLHFQIDGHWVSVKQVANLQPRPFFRPGVAAKRAEVAAILAAGFRKLIAEAI